MHPLKFHSPQDPRGSEITSPAVYAQRRQWLQQAMALGLLGSGQLGAWAQSAAPLKGPGQASALAAKVNLDAGMRSTGKPTAYDSVTSYNNFYEFGTDKSDPARLAGTLQTRPWTLRIEGLVSKPLTLGIDELLKLAPMQERIYRLRCVEAWSMVIPWVGYSLSALIAKAQPLGSAKFIEFVTLADPKRMPGVSSSILQWPYREGLRLDEAMHPLSLLAFGLYGEQLLPQNGAPVRLVVPWKYGFKSAKSIVAIRFVEKQPISAWMQSAPREYGFYANVNPQVNHPRWSQAHERPIGGGLFAKRQPTLPFNGYAEQVASLYTGMNLQQFF